MRDYLKLLHHLMQIHGNVSIRFLPFEHYFNKKVTYPFQKKKAGGQGVPNAILKAETVNHVFIPALPEKGVKSLSEFLKTEGTSWSTGLSVCTTDLAGRRRKGSVWGKRPTPLFFSITSLF